MKNHKDARMAKLIDFPKSKIVRDVTLPLEELDRLKAKGRQNLADTMVADIATSLHVELENYGVDTSFVPFKRDFIFLMDVLKSTIYRNMKIEHGLHEFIDKTVKIYTKTDDGMELVDDDELEIDEIDEDGELPKWSSSFVSKDEDKD
jgi:hypothetical protein